MSKLQHKLVLHETQQYSEEVGVAHKVKPASIFPDDDGTVLVK